MNKKTINLTLLALSSILFPSYLFAGQSSLIEAIEKGDVQTVTELIKTGADVNAKDDNGKTPLMYSICLYSEKPGVLPYDGRALNVWDPKSKTAGIVYIAYKKELTGLLLSKGADVNAKDISGKTALMVAAESPWKEQPQEEGPVELLLSKGANVNAKDNNGMTALDFAVKADHKRAIALLRAQHRLEIR